MVQPATNGDLTFEAATYIQQEDNQEHKYKYLYKYYISQKAWSTLSTHLLLKSWVLYMNILAKSVEFHNAKGEFERSKWDLVPLVSTRMTLTLEKIQLISLRFVGLDQN